MSHGFKAKAELTGENELPPVLTEACGTLFIESCGDHKLRYRLTIRDISGLAQVHLQAGITGQIGPTIALLTPLMSPFGLVEKFEFTADLTSSDLLGPLTGKSIRTLIDQIKFGNVYANARTISYPLGEVRGQVLAENC